MSFGYLAAFYAEGWGFFATPEVNPKRILLQDPLRKRVVNWPADSLNTLNTLNTLITFLNTSGYAQRMGGMD